MIFGCHVSVYDSMLEYLIIFFKSISCLLYTHIFIIYNFYLFFLYFNMHRDHNVLVTFLSDSYSDDLEMIIEATED